MPRPKEKPTISLRVGEKAAALAVRLVKKLTGLTLSQGRAVTYLIENTDSERLTTERMDVVQRIAETLYDIQQRDEVGDKVSIQIRGDAADIVWAESRFKLTATELEWFDLLCHKYDIRCEVGVITDHDLEKETGFAARYRHIAPKVHIPEIKE